MSARRGIRAGPHGAGDGRAGSLRVVTPSSSHAVLAQALFLGDDLLAWLLLALGGALVVGYGLALVRPPAQSKPGELSEAPRGRSLVMIGIGVLCAIWALGSLVSG